MMSYALKSIIQKKIRARQETEPWRNKVSKNDKSLVILNLSISKLVRGFFPVKTTKARTVQKTSSILIHDFVRSN